MSAQEKSILASLFAFFITAAGFYPSVSGKYAAGKFDGAEGMVLLGKTGLAFVGIAIAMIIISMILLSIIFAIITQEAKPSFVVDERDHLIEKRGMQISGYLTGAAVISGLIALALGKTATFVLVLILASYVLAELIGSVARLVMYRMDV